MRKRPLEAVVQAVPGRQHGRAHGDRRREVGEAASLPGELLGRGSLPLAAPDGFLQDARVAVAAEGRATCLGREVWVAHLELAAAGQRRGGLVGQS